MEQKDFVCNVHQVSTLILRFKGVQLVQKCIASNAYTVHIDNTSFVEFTHLVYEDAILKVYC